MYSQDIKNKVCDLIAEGKSLRAIEAITDMPSMTSVMRWCIEDVAFCEQYARAKEQQSEVFAEELIDIADDVTTNEEDVQRSKLRIETRKWLMGKMKPKKYGDVLKIEGDLKLVKIKDMTGKK